MANGTGTPESVYIVYIICTLVAMGLQIDTRTLALTYKTILEIYFVRTWLVQSHVKVTNQHGKDDSRLHICKLFAWTSKWF